MTAEELCKELIGERIENISISNGVILTVDSKKYHFVSDRSERENGSDCVDTYVYIDGQHKLTTTA